MKRWLLILEILLGVGVLFGAAFWASDRVLDFLMGDVYQRAAVAEARATAAEVARQLDGEREAVLSVARSLAEQPVLQDAKAEPDALAAALGRVKDQLGDARALIVNGKLQVKDHDFSLTKLPCTKTAEGGAECVQFGQQDDKGLLIVAEPLPKGQGALLVLQPLSPRMAAWVKALSPGAVAALIRDGAVLASSQPLVGYNPAAETQRVGRDDHVSFKLAWSPELELIGLAPVGMSGSSAERGLQVVFLALGGATLLMMLLFVLTQPYPKAMRQAVEPPVAPATGEIPSPLSERPAVDPDLPVPPLAAVSAPPSQQPSLSRPAIALASQPTADPLPAPEADPTPLPAPTPEIGLRGSGFSDPPASFSSAAPTPPAMAGATQSMGPTPQDPGDAEVRSAFDAIADAAFASAPPPVAHSVGPVPGDLPIPKGGLSPEVAQASVNQRHTDLPQPKSSSSMPARPASFGGSLSPSSLPMSTSGAIPLPGQGTVAAAADDGPFSESHYTEVYEQFVAAKRRHGESVDRIQLAGFSAKLRKSEQALINKHKCKAVRFQVIEKGNAVSLRPQLIR